MPPKAKKKEKPSPQREYKTTETDHRDTMPAPAGGAPCAGMTKQEPEEPVQPDRSIIPNDSLIARHMAMAQQRSEELLRQYNINEHTMREWARSY